MSTSISAIATATATATVEYESIVQLLMDEMLVSLCHMSSSNNSSIDLDSQSCQSLSPTVTSYICLSSDESCSTIWLHSDDSSTSDSLPSLLVPLPKRVTKRRFISQCEQSSDDDDERLPSVKPARKYSRLDFDLSSGDESSSSLPSLNLQPCFKRSAIVLSNSDTSEDNEPLPFTPTIRVVNHCQHDLDSTMEDASDFDFD